MQRLAGIMLVGAVAVAISGCALRDPRADLAYSRASDGLWGDAPFELIDWNFPTSQNQPPVEAPKRLRLERTAIGVPWATRNPLPLSDNLAPYDAPTWTSKADERPASTPAQAVRTSSAGSNPPDSERRGAR